jgi:valyl-tRNA synthetase
MNNPGTQVLTVADLSRMLVKADVDETDVVDVKAGQAAIIKVDALPDTSFVGTVTEVGNSAAMTSSSATSGETNFEVKVLFSDTVEAVSNAMEAYQFDAALKAIREFAWDVLADNYIELVKGRLYQQDASRKSACLVLHTAFDALCRLLAPFTPYFAEECYSYLGDGQSVHKQQWVSFTYDDEAARREGNMIVQVVAEVRKYKHDNSMALNAPLGRVTIYAPHTVDDEGDTGRTLNADVHWRTDVAKLDRAVTDVEFNRSVIGKTFRKDAQAFMDAVKALAPAQLEKPPKTLKINGKDIEIPADAFAPKFSYMEEGAKVDVLTIGDVIVTIAKK